MDEQTRAIVQALLDPTGPFMKGGYNDQPTVAHQLRQLDAGMMDANRLRMLSDSMGDKMFQNSDDDAMAYWGLQNRPNWQRGT